MQAIFDNLTSIFVSGVVLLIFVFLQFRSTMSAAEQTINYSIVSEAFQINQLLERDLENMLTEAQTNVAINAGNYTGSTSTFNCVLNTANNRIQNIIFPTIEEPDSTMNAADPANTDVIEVNYVLSQTTDSLMVPVNDIPQRVPLFELHRLVDGDTTASSARYITNLTMQFTRKTGDVFPVDPVATTVTNCEDNLAKVRFEFTLAAEGVEFISKDQRSTSRHNMSRFGATVNLTNWE